MFRQVISERVLPGIYICKENGRGIIVDEDGKYYCGTVVVKKDRYRYFQYRAGKKVFQKYIKKTRPKHWLPDY